MFSPNFVLVAVAVLILQQLSLGSTQECGGFMGLVALTQDQLKKEICAEASSLLESIFSPSGSNGSMCGMKINKFEELVNSTVENAVHVAVEVATEKVSEEIQHKLEVALNKTTTELLTKVERLITGAVVQMQQLQQLGKTSSHPASSCREIKELIPFSSSGHYWIRNSGGSTVQVYCDMARSCGGITGGWMQVAKLNMSDANDVCPTGLRNITSPKRLCGINSDGPGCSSAVFSVEGIEYSRVCGKIIAVQYGSPDAFYSYGARPSTTIDGRYVDGISLTYGRNPRRHIWTFAAAVHELLHKNPFKNVCRCTVPNNRATLPVPSYVGNDYFCATASKDQWRRRYYPEDPLWDGRGCGPSNTCCMFNRPPWFMKQLPATTTDNIEMRVCADEPRDNEDIAIEIVELYVQ